MIAVDWVFFTLTAGCVFLLRRRDAGRDERVFEVPGHPVSTIAFVVIGMLIVAVTVYKYPLNSLAGLGILAAGIPVYFLWARSRAKDRARPFNSLFRLKEGSNHGH